MASILDAVGISGESDFVIAMVGLAKGMLASGMRP
jgi:hypothetical protein